MSPTSRAPIDSCVGHEDPGDSLETSLVIRVKPSGPRAVDVQNAKHPLIRHQRNDNFGTGRRIAGDVAGKLVHVRHYDCLAALHGGSAHSLADSDAYAGGSTLKRAHDELAAPQKIESGPVDVRQGPEKQSRSVGSVGDEIGLPRQQTRQLPGQERVVSRLVLELVTLARVAHDP